MTIPSTAATVPGRLDPQEELNWRINLGNILEDGEAVAGGTWTLEVLSEGVALGLTIMSGSGRDAALDSDSRSILFWLKIDSLFGSNAAFDGGGVDLPMRITFSTDSTPARKRQRTFLVHTAQA